MLIVKEMQYLFLKNWVGVILYRIGLSYLRHLIDYIVMMNELVMNFILAMDLLN
jgi:hypothetical protein